jgi:toxin ParE1/3/4
MSRSLRKSALFEADVAVRFGWYVQEAGERVAWRFLGAVELTIARLADQPEIGRVRYFKDARLQGLRSLRVDVPFSKVLIFYRASSDGIELWRMMHGARNLPVRLKEAPEV